MRAANACHPRIALLAISNLGTLSLIGLLHFTTFSTFVSENSALGAKLIMAAR